MIFACFFTELGYVAKIVEAVEVECVETTGEFDYDLMMDTTQPPLPSYDASPSLLHNQHFQDNTYSTESDSSPNTSTAKSQPTLMDYVNQPKYIIFQENLLSLLKFCPGCSQPIIDTTITTQGTMVAVHYHCLGGCAKIWYSQPRLNRTGVGTILAAASVPISGTTFQVISDYSKSINLQLMGKTRYN